MQITSQRAIACKIWPACCGEIDRSVHQITGEGVATSSGKDEAISTGKNPTNVQFSTGSIRMCLIDVKRYYIALLL